MPLAPLFKDGVAARRKVLAHLGHPASHSHSSGMVPEQLWTCCRVLWPSAVGEEPALHLLCGMSLQRSRPYPRDVEQVSRRQGFHDSDDQLLGQVQQSKGLSHPDVWILNAPHLTVQRRFPRIQCVVNRRMKASVWVSEEDLPHTHVTKGNVHHHTLSKAAPRLQTHVRDMALLKEAAIPLETPY